MTVGDLINKLNLCDVDATVMILSNFDLVKVNAVEQIVNVNKIGVGIQLSDDKDKSVVLLSQ